MKDIINTTKRVVTDFSFSHIKNIKSFYTAISYLTNRIVYVLFFKKHIISSVNTLNHGNPNVIFNSNLGFRIRLNLNKIVDKRFYVGEFEKDTLKVFGKILKPDHIVLDIGANIGIFTLYAASKLGPNGKIHSFEPAEEAYRCLKENIALNNFSNIVINKVGIAAKTGSLTFNVCEDDAYNSFSSNPMQDIKYSVSIPVTTIDDYCSLNSIQKIDILKIDIEGAELLAFKGGVKMLSGANSPIIFSEYNRSSYTGLNYKLEEFNNLIYSYGYEIFELKYGVIKPFEHNKSKTYDIICLKKEHFKLFNLSTKIK